jgi:ribose transport system substrate-binding protein
MEEKMKRTAVFLLAVFCLLIAAGSVFAAGGKQQGSAGGTQKVYYIGKEAGSVYWQTVNRGADVAAKDLGINLISLNPNSESEVDKQVTMVETAINDKAAAIVLAPLDSQALIQPCINARNAGIPLIIVDSMIASNDFDAAYMTDNYNGGELCADFLAEQLNGTGTVFIINAVAGSGSLIARQAGFIDRMKSAHKGVKILNENDVIYCNNDPITAATQAVDTIAANPSLNAFFAPNTNVLKGVGQGVKEAGKGGKILVAGFDSDDDIVALVKEGVITGMILQSPYKMGYMGVEGALKRIKGEIPNNASVNDTGCFMATKANLDDPQIKELL